MSRLEGQGQLWLGLGLLYNSFALIGPEQYTSTQIITLITVSLPCIMCVANRVNKSSAAENSATHFHNFKQKWLRIQN